MTPDARRAAHPDPRRALLRGARAVATPHPAARPPPARPRRRSPPRTGDHMTTSRPAAPGSSPAPTCQQLRSSRDFWLPLAIIAALFFVVLPDGAVPRASRRSRTSESSVTQIGNLMGSLPKSIQQQDRRTRARTCRPRTRSPSTSSRRSRSSCRSPSPPRSVRRRSSANASAAAASSSPTRPPPSGRSSSVSCSRASCPDTSPPASGFLLYSLIVNLIVGPQVGRLVLPYANWWILVLWVVPPFLALVVGIILRISSRVTSAAAAQQASALVTLPLVILAYGLSTGSLSRARDLRRPARSRRVDRRGRGALDRRRLAAPGTPARSRRLTRAAAFAVFAAIALLATACDSSSGRDRSTPSTADSGTAVTTTIKAVPLGPAIVFTAQAPRARRVRNDPTVRDPDRRALARRRSRRCRRERPDLLRPDRTPAASSPSIAPPRPTGRRDGASSSSPDTRSASSPPRSRTPRPDVPVAIEPEHGPTPFGCAFLPDGRLLTTDVGNPSTGAAERTADRVVPALRPGRSGGARARSTSPSPRPKALLVDGDAVLRCRESRAAVLTSFVTATLPTSNESSGGCTAPRHDRRAVRLRRRAAQRGSAAPPRTACRGPRRIAPAGNGNYYVSSPSTGVIAEVERRRSARAPRARAARGREARRAARSPPARRSVSASDPTARSTTPISGSSTRTAPRVAGAAGGNRPAHRVHRRCTATTARSSTAASQSPAGIGIWIPSA